MVICLKRGADLHMVQLMPLPLTVSCFSKIQIGFTFLVLAYLGCPGQSAVKRVCCVCFLLRAVLRKTVAREETQATCRETDMFITTLRSPNRQQIRLISLHAATGRHTVDGPEMSDHCEADQVSDGHDYDCCERRVRDVEEQRSEECQSQQHQHSYTADVISQPHSPGKLREASWQTIRYDTRCYFNVRSKADISQLNLPHGTDN